MLIRFVQDGVVRFRTRGWLGIKDNSEELDGFCLDNPTFLDPNFAPRDSLLFEWTSPISVSPGLSYRSTICLFGDI